MAAAVAAEATSRCGEEPRRGETGEGSRVEIQTCNDSSLTQVWSLNSAGELQQQASGLCLNVIGGATSEGSLLQLWSCTGTPNEVWSLNQSSQLVGAGSGLCLYPVGGTTSAGTPVQIWSCAGDPASEIWTARQTGELKGQGSGLCLNVDNGATSEGSSLIIYSCAGSTPTSRDTRRRGYRSWTSPPARSVRVSAPRSAPR